MIKAIKSKIRKIAFGDRKNNLSHLSFSQAGEDRIVSFLFKSMGWSDIRYLEIGTNDPVDNNNTYAFYKRGCRGVCIEANPHLIRKIRATRPEDICLNVGINTCDASSMNFYIFDGADLDKGLSTFSKAEVEHIEKTSDIRVAKIIQIPVITLNEVMETYFAKKAPDFVSLDAEGIDLEILETLDFGRFRPPVFCIETVLFSMSHIRKKRTDILDFMLSKDYFVYGETGINTIFVDNAIFQNPKGSETFAS